MVGERTDTKRFFAGEKSPFTNTAKSTLFCSPKVNISLLFTEDLQHMKMLGEVCINSGFCWGIATGIYCANLAGEGVAVVGVRAADWPRNVAQRVTLPSLKFEQADVCPDGPSPATGEGYGVGADAPAATFGAYLCAVRTMLQHRSYPARQATERGSSRGNLSPLTVFWFLLYAQKERHGGEPYQPSPSGDSATPKATANLTLK